MLRKQTRSRRMVGADVSTELWRVWRHLVSFILQLDTSNAIGYGKKYLVLVTEISGSGNRDLGRAGLQVSPCHVRDLQGRQRFRPEYFDERYEL